MRCQCLRNGVVDAEVEHGVEHARHRLRRPGPHAEQQRPRASAEGARGLVLQPPESVEYVGPHPIQGALVTGQQRRTHVGGEAESRRDGQSEGAHLVDAKPLVAERFTRQEGIAVK
jgi:hypothetical protein